MNAATPTPSEVRIAALRDRLELLEWGLAQEGPGEGVSMAIATVERLIVDAEDELHDRLDWLRLTRRFRQLTRGVPLVPFQRTACDGSDLPEHFARVSLAQAQRRMGGA